jgi:ATP-dependent DNA ligase
MRVTANRPTQYHSNGCTAAAAAWPRRTNVLAWGQRRTAAPSALPVRGRGREHLKVRSCLIDGEVVCSDESGLARFDVLRRRRNEAVAFLYAFDLLELDGTDLRREPLEVRKTTLASVLRQAKGGVRLNEYLAHDCGLTVFQHACKMGLEGIISKRLGSRYRSGRSPDWLSS